MTLLDILIDGRKKIESGWCKRAIARTSDDTPCQFDDPGAVKFCMAGAVMMSNSAIVALRDCLPGLWPSQFNDLEGTTKEDVLTVFDKAIKRAGMP